ncbi:long-chain-alcohol O-fatty-acyltransferase 1 [Hirschfeldia incana]|nr:long-chain-alcohol O-fatty-acyltransferase 1 [Hirschfeldia incana]
MEEEFRNLIKVWISALISISFCYYISSKISKAFFLTWLANFKLALFAFDQEPLSPLPSTLTRFFCFACFPIKTNRNPSSTRTYNKPMPKWVLASKIIIFSFLLHLYRNNYHNSLTQLPFLAIFTVHIYLESEFILFSTGTLLSTLLGCEIEPVFNEPYLATSLQDFWSRRWNRMVPSILRPTVHIPVQQYTTPLIGPKMGFYAGVLASFLVSGLMHELIYFYIIRKSPTWEVTCFFMLHGVVTSLEIWVKSMRLCPPPHRAVSSLCVLVFVFVTAGWLFTPQVLRNDVHKRVINECLFVIDFVKSQVVNTVM